MLAPIVKKPSTEKITLTDICEIFMELENEKKKENSKRFYYTLTIVNIDKLTPKYSIILIPFCKNVLLRCKVQ